MQHVTDADFTCYTLQTDEALPAECPLLCVPAGNRHLGWLIAADAHIIDMSGDDTPSLALPVRLEHDPADSTVKLQQALRRRSYLSLKGSPAELGFRQKSQVFRVVPTEAPAEVAAIATQLTAAIGAPVCWTVILLALRSRNLHPDLVDSALRCLPMDELDLFARHLLESPTDLAMLQAATRSDPWFLRRIPSLIAWRHAHGHSHTQAANSGPASTADLPGAKSNPSHRITLGLVLNGFARAATPPRRMACILATARNEGAYLIEWIAHHRAIGFEHIFLYTNDNTDGSDDLLQLLADAGIISWFRNQVQPDTLPQHRAYGHALSVMPDILDYRWTMIADIDEFAGLDIDAFQSMPDYILWQEQRRAEAIALSWKLHVASPGDVWRDAPSIERFPLREKALDSHVKMMFRTNMAWNANPHHPEPRLGTSFVYRSELGEPYVQKVTPAQSAVPSARFAWISHYAFRSAPEMLMKLARGRADQPAELQAASAANRIRTFVTQLCSTNLIEDRSTLRTSARLADERRRLLTIPNLAACEADIKNAYVNGMRQACEDFLSNATPPKSEHIAKLTALMQTSLAA